MKKEKFLGPFYCITAALVWGLSFVAQKSGASVGTFTFNGIRNLLGGLVLIPLVIFAHRKKNKGLAPGEKIRFDFKGMLKGGLVCGTVLAIAGSLQQQAFVYDIEAGKVAFITALYMMLVPIAGLFFGRKPEANVWTGIVLGVIGLYFICIKKGDFSIGKGELFALACAVGFAVHIMVIGKYCNEVDNLSLACGQFLTAGILLLPCMFIFEKPDMSAVISCAPQILYAGIGSCAVAFTCQIFGQKYTEPAVASLLMCLESVFATLFGWLILHDNLGTRALVGCAIMFAGVIISQISFSTFRKKKA